MSISEQVTALATRIGHECYTLHGKCGVLTNLTTKEKTSLVGAVNELKTSIDTVSGQYTTLSGKVTANEQAIAAMSAQLVGGVAHIDDSQVSASSTYSSQKISSEITAAKQAVKDEILGGAGDAYDTLKELADLIDENKDAIDALEQIANNHVRYDQKQTLTDEQKTQARSNIGAASTTELTALQSTVSGNTTKIDALTTAVGDTEADFVAVFETALSGS